MKTIKNRHARPNRQNWFKRSYGNCRWIRKRYFQLGCNQEFGIFTWTLSWSLNGIDIVFSFATKALKKSVKPTISVNAHCVGKVWMMFVHWKRSKNCQGFGAWHPPLRKMHAIKRNSAHLSENPPLLRRCSFRKPTGSLYWSTLSCPSSVPPKKRPTGQRTISDVNNQARVPRSAWGNSASWLRT